MTLSKSLTFLSALKANNNREWFNDHKEDYQASKREFEDFIYELMQVMKDHDHIDEKNTKIYRIFKDVRFARDKTPYKTSWSCNIKRASKDLRGGYYIQIGPEQSMMAGGFFGPNPQDLLHLRKQISQDSDELRKALGDAAFKNYFGELRGETVKTAPKGFSKEDPNLDLLRHKQFFVRREYTDKEVGAADFITEVDRGFRLMRPYFDVMSEFLTTDLNGLPLE